MMYHDMDFGTSRTIAQMIKVYYYYILLDPKEKESDTP